MRFLSVLVIAAMVLAGCAGAPAPVTEQDDTFDDVDYEVSDTTGAILGVVVDDTITPIAGADVRLTIGQDEALEATSDAQGRFVFSDLPAGVYFVKVSKKLHESVQTSVTVEAGVQDPPRVHIQLPRTYQVTPQMIPIKQDGYFQCSQNGASVQYSSSPCYSTNPQVIPEGTFVEEREWHADVPAGWVSQVFEMTWKQSMAGTGENMGLVVSSYKPERSGTHSFANVASSNPMRFELLVGETGPGSAAGSGPMGQTIPAEGMEDMSFFASVRKSNVAPAVAIEQRFTVYIHQFVACDPGEGWSVIQGSDDPC